MRRWTLGSVVLGATAADAAGPGACVCTPRGTDAYGGYCASWDSKDEKPWCAVASAAACGEDDTFESEKGLYWAHLACDGMAPTPPDPAHRGATPGAGGAAVQAVDANDRSPAASCRLFRSNDAVHRCCMIAVRHHPQLGMSWGSTPPRQQAEWQRLQCDGFSWEIGLGRAYEKHGRHPLPLPQTELRVLDGEKRAVTVVVSSFKQPSCLQRQVYLWRKCPLVAEVRINWFEGQGDSAQPTWSRDAAFAPVVIDKLPNSLSHRFAPRAFKTDAVFSVDVDMLYSCRALQHTYRVWRAHPKRMVGFHPREVPHGFEHSYLARNRYARNLILVTKGGMQHRDVFAAYFRKDYDALRRRIDENLQGEDFLMSFVQAKHFDPIVHFVCLGYEEMCQYDCHEGKGSLSGTPAQYRKRKAVLDAIFKQMGDVLKRQEGTKSHMTWFPKKEESNRGQCHSLVVLPYNGDSATLEGAGCTSSVALVYPKGAIKYSSEFRQAFAEGRLTLS